jgi:hypothetical protein
MGGGRRLETAVVAQQSAQVDAVDEPHREERDAVDLVGMEDVHDVRVLDRGEQPRLPHEPLLERCVVRDVRAQDLERHVASEAEILGTVDDAHAALAEHTEDAVPREHCTERERSAQRADAHMSVPLTARAPDHEDGAQPASCGPKS